MAFTRNYKNLIMNSLVVDQLDGSSSSSYSFDISSVRNMKDVNGTLFQMAAYGGTTTYMSNASLCSNYTNGADSYINVGAYRDSSSSTYSKNIVFGSGTAAESIDDYKLENLITTISKSGNFSKKIEILSDGSIKITVSGVIVSTADATINEIGISKEISYSYNRGYYKTALLFRKVLETPIELTADIPAAISFDITIPNIMPEY